MENKKQNNKLDKLINTKLDKLYNTKLYKFIEKQNALNERLEKDKKACKNNIWHQLTLNDIETLEYQLNNEKNKVKELESKLKKQSQLIKQIQGLASNYFEPKTNPENHIYKTDLLTDSQYIFKILPKANQLIFNESTPEQWRYILDGKTPLTEIEVKKKVSLKDVRYFFDKLRETEIIKIQYIKNLVATKGIFFNGKPLNIKQLNDAYQSNKKLAPKLSEQINAFFNLV